MANLTHVEMLRSGIKDWNDWREANPGTMPDLSDIDLRGFDFADANLESVDFRKDWGDDTDIKTAISADVFFTKINSNGTYGYTKTIGSDGGEMGKSITIDLNDNIFLLGYFISENIDFDPTLCFDIKYNDDDYYDIFITKIGIY